VGGRRKPLKRLDPAMEIQGFPWLKFGRALLDEAPILLDLDSALIFLGACPHTIERDGAVKGVSGSRPGIGGLAGFVRVGEVQATASLAADGLRP